MASTMKVEIIQRETIKPSSPTPPNLKIHKISLLDQVLVTNYVPIVLFYAANGEHITDRILNQRSQLLKQSLSEALTQYYPLAGRIKDHLSIECNDEGAEFVEARINCSLSDHLRNPDIQQFEGLIPAKFTTPVTTESSLVLVQANYFQCGGVAMAFCLSHKIVDGVTYFTFINKWASIVRGSDDGTLPDLTIASSLFPPQDSQIPAFEFPPIKQCVRRRFIFTPSSIAALKAKIAGEGVENPTTIEVVGAHIWKCIITAARSLGRESGVYICGQSVDMRRRFSPPISETSVGNLLAPLATVAELEGDEEIDLHSLVLKLRRVANEFKVKKGENIFAELNEEMMSLVREKNAHSFFLTISCEMPVYEADFGWGKPIWFTNVMASVSNFVTLNNTSEGDGSVEVILVLVEEEMAVLEGNEELLEFATFSPSIV
ncbi:stemmadenine O-acetyltransferase-like [Tripterygium wilfordii]|uniref:stemmadenine O-acetyltransferase-like n=1 Tax=Tripterygium wilfordii TaxID=458696 RepID=UPI0018F7E992|nr:stemmadenine O-acetyltransferase-like [Tripterygium wilfordii]